MNPIFDSIKKIRDNFDTNLDDTKYNSFRATKSILSDFKEIFNPKNLFIAAMFATSSANAFDNPQIIDKVFNDSLKIQSIHYNEKLPTYFENKETIEKLKKDTILKNEFWKGNVTTLVFDDVDENIAKEINPNYKENIDVLNQNDQPAYAKRYSKDEINQEKVNDFFSGSDKYHHLIKNDGSIIEGIKERISVSNRYLVDDFITYHEMAHSTYEQNVAQYLNFLHLDLNISDSIRAETHSDISSVLMVAKKHNLSFEEFKSFATDISTFRGYAAKQIGDLHHNSSTALLDLVYNLEDNEYIYNTLDKEKISSFSAYYVDQLYKTPSETLMKNLNKIGLETDVVSLIENIEKVSKNIGNAGQLINLNAKEHFYLNFMQDAYYKLNPKKMKELIDASNDSEDLLKSKYVSLLVETNLSFKSLTDSETMIYAVNINKKLKAINYSEYSNSITGVAGSEINKLYTDSLLSDHFNESKKELKEAIKHN